MDSARLDLELPDLRLDEDMEVVAGASLTAEDGVHILQQAGWPGLERTTGL